MDRTSLLFLALTLILGITVTFTSLAALRSSKKGPIYSAFVMFLLFFLSTGVFIGIETGFTFSLVTLLPVLIIILYVVVAKKNK